MEQGVKENLLCLGCHVRNILVLGGGGFLGTHIVNLLAAGEYHVTVVDPFMPPQVPPRAVWVQESVMNRPLYRSLLRCNDTVIDLTDTGKPGSTVKNITTDIISALSTSVENAEIAKAEGIKKFVFPSSGGTVYGQSSTTLLNEERSPCNPINMYGLRKLVVEHYLRLMTDPVGFRPVCLRIANAYGEGQKTAQGQGFIAAVFDAVRTSKPVNVLGSGKAIRDFVYVGDVTRAFERAILYSGPHCIFNIGTGLGYSILEVINKISIVTNQKIAIVDLPKRPFDVDSNILNAERAQQHLGWVAETELTNGLERTAKWWNL
jgi:UDP-glucose 4-epimerase